MTFGTNSAPFDGGSMASPSQGGGSRPPAGADRKRWSLRTSANVAIGVTGALWALVAIVLKILF